MPPLWVIRASVLVRSTRLGQLLGALLGRLTARAAGRPAEWGGMSMFVDQAVAGDDPRLAQVYANFESNLRGIVAAAAAAGAKAILCTPVANLKDCAPFLSRHRPGLTGAELAAWQSDFDAGKLSWLLGENEAARGRLEAARARDPQYAETEFMLGRIDLAAGDVSAGRSHLQAALHWDALRFRPDSRIGEIIRSVAQEAPGTTLLLDTARALGSDPASPEPPSGRELLFEHVHFDWTGSYRVGRLAAAACAAVLGGPPSRSAWLDASEGAAAVAYTPHERLPMLLRIDVLERKPPFTNQLTHLGDEAAMARDIAVAQQLGRTPATLRDAAAIAESALARDPGNPSLAGILEGIRLDEGRLEEALALARQAQAGLPRDFALAADEASILLRLGRYPEAEAILKAGARSGADLDLLAPVWADFWTRTKRLREGRQFLDAAIARLPGDRRLRIVRAGLQRAAGDAAGAEEELRAVLAADPASEDALEGLAALLAETGRAALVGPLSLAAAPAQPRNQANSLRAAQECGARGDADGALRCLRAAESSGPVTATFELTLALKYYQERHFPAVLLHLAQARRLSLAEGNPQVTASIDGLVRRMRAEAASAR
jgi:tetratricopeptide (TPR) repeat protein